MPTPKQKNYIMLLLKKSGRDVRYMDKSYKALGAGMRQRSGSVEGWIDTLNAAEASNVIDILKQETGG